jgi:peptidoglycan/xylan/chitin deacetylase (PgdA/CDA1 family)
VKEGAQGGTVTTTGTYTAPSAPGVYHVVAEAPGPAQAEAEVVVAAANAIAVAVEPATVGLTTLATATFTAKVTGTTDSRVTWSVQEAAPAGAVTAAGLYTAPAVTGTFHVVATSVADGSKKGAATVTVAAPPAVAISISPKTAVLGPGQTYDFACSVTGSADTACTFKVSESAGGTIAATTGRYLAPASPGTFHVVATSHADAARTDTATVTVVPPSSGTTLRFAIDRRAVPPLTYNDLTVRVFVGAATAGSASADGKVVASTYDRASGWAVITTAGNLLEISVTGGDPGTPGFGSFAKAVLKGDKKWAWSHGYDDNTNFKQHGIDLFTSRGWQATLFVICKIVDPTRDENWIVDAPDLKRLVQQGWGIGNHTWSHAYVADLGGAAGAKADVLKCADLLRSIVNAAKPEYRLISVASPMFDSAYLPVIQDLRAHDASHEIQFLEGQGDPVLQVDGPLDRSASIGRDWAIQEAGSGSANDNLPTIDGIHAKADPTHHYWYNTLAHGIEDQYPSKGIFKFVPYLHSKYGPGGTDEVWVAPSDAVYSYLLVRDLSVVTKL